LVDDEDYPLLIGYRWRLNSHGYVIRSYTVNGRGSILALHREIMQPPPQLVVDHIDHNKLNNTRANLRIITQQQNVMNRRLFSNNTTGFKGVTYEHHQWHARVEKDGLRIHLGYYDDLKTAALVYDCAAVLLFGAEYVWRNLPTQPIPAALEALTREYLRRAGQL